MSVESSFASSSPVVGAPSFKFYQDDPPPPPDALQLDDHAAADQARQRLNKRGLLSSVSLPHLGRSPSKSSKRRSTVSFPALPDLSSSEPNIYDAPQLVELPEDWHISVEVDEDYNKDVYRWAVLYENQRGITAFSTPYYSPLTLLPLDPPPFTIPTAITSPRRNQPTVSLEDYPLPDGSWKWVSRAWMIDMRGDGQVQYDGFEYSRSFRSKNWGPSPGTLSHRGLVRRRRWVRLMMRPARIHHEPEADLDAPASGYSLLPEFEHTEEGATRPPSVVLTVSDVIGGTEIWKGDADDWERCHTALRRLGRDGRKLELWARWLGLSQTAPSSPRPPSWTPVIAPYLKAMQPDRKEKGNALLVPEVSSIVDRASIYSSRTDAEKLVEDSGASIAPAPKDFISAVVRTHGSELLGLLIYPDSRAKFLGLLERVGLLSELQASVGVSDSAQFLDFWSYTQHPDSGGS